nr:hypothetical protein BaRGS_035146 [Batillaria attramentaria]
MDSVSEGSSTREASKGRPPSLQDRPLVPSPYNGLGIRGNGDSPGGDTDVMSDDSLDNGPGVGEQSPGRNDGVVQDCKNSRRKMERPRKRKREELESGDEVFPDSPHSAALVAAAEVAAADVSRQGLLSVENSRNRRPQSRGTVNSVSSPEDLSLKSTTSSSDVPGQKQQSSTHPSTSISSPVVQGSERDTPGGSHWHGAGGGVNLGHVTPSDVTPSAVKELEAVMNRHLPFLETGQPALHSDASPPVRSGGSLRPSGCSNNFPAHAKKSTIQWVGSQSSAASSDGMAASTFLRSLYESRESVIRSNGSCTSTNASSTSSSSNNNISTNSSGGEVGAHRSGHMYGDLTNSMLTPPGSEAYKDHPPPFSIPSIVISTASSLPSSSAPASHSLKCVPGYGSQLSRGYPTALSLALPCGGLSDTYGMTPPSSVSPQDKLSSPFAAAAALVYNESSHTSAHCGGIGRSSLHHPSSSPTSQSSSSSANTSHAHLPGKDVVGCTSVTSGHMSDYNSAKAAYYAMSALNAGHPGHTGYADVNHNTTPAYDQCSRPVIPWY